MRGYRIGLAELWQIWAAHLSRRVDGGQENSRLSCQILVDETLDGLVVRIPEPPDHA